MKIEFLLPKIRNETGIKGVEALTCIGYMYKGQPDCKPYGTRLLYSGFTIRILGFGIEVTWLS